MGRFASEQLCRALALVILAAVSVPALAQNTTLPPGIQESSVVAGQAREQLSAYINENYEVMKSGSIAQQRAARDNLLNMFNAPSVSTAFRQTATSILAPHIEESLNATNRWDRFAGYRLAAKLATEDSARWFSRVIDSNESIEKSDGLMALGQVRVMFLEVDIGGLAVSQATLSRLAESIGRGLAEESDADIGLLQSRALRALAQGTRSELDDAHSKAAQALASAIATRHQGRGNRAPTASAEDTDQLLIDLEAMDAIRAYLVTRDATKSLPAPVAKALGQLAGQSLGFVTRTYDRIPANADASRRYMQRLAQRSMEITSMLVVDLNSTNPSRPVNPAGIPSASEVGAWLAAKNMQRFKVGVIQTIDTLGTMFNFGSGWVTIE